MDRNWVSDQLHSLLGVSEDTTVSYLIAMAKQARSNL